MKKVGQLIFFSILIASFVSCNKNTPSTCDNNVICYTEAPDSLWVKLDLATENYTNPIEVNFYFGYMDNGELYDTYTTVEDVIYYLVPVDQRYTATAQYIKGSDTIIVIDSDKLYRDYCSYEDEDMKCYNWDYEIIMDLKLDD